MVVAVAKGRGLCVDFCWKRPPPTSHNPPPSPSPFFPLGFPVSTQAIIEEGATVTQSIVCRDAIVRRGATVSQGCIVSHRVVIGPGFEVQPYTKLTTVVQVRIGNENWDRAAKACCAWPWVVVAMAAVFRRSSSPLCLVVNPT